MALCSRSAEVAAALAAPLRPVIRFAARALASSRQGTGKLGASLPASERQGNREAIDEGGEGGRDLATREGHPAEGLWAEHRERLLRGLIKRVVKRLRPREAQPGDAVRGGQGAARELVEVVLIGHRHLH